jgi:hypothetical protein
MAESSAVKKAAVKGKWRVVMMGIQWVFLMASMRVFHLAVMKG